MSILFLWKKIRWKWISFWGRHFRIVETDNIKNDNEIIIYHHKIYKSKKK